MRRRLTFPVHKPSDGGNFPLADTIVHGTPPNKIWNVISALHFVRRIGSPDLTPTLAGLEA